MKMRNDGAKKNENILRFLKKTLEPHTHVTSDFFHDKRKKHFQNFCHLRETLAEYGSPAFAYFCGASSRLKGNKT